MSKSVKLNSSSLAKLCHQSYQAARCGHESEWYFLVRKSQMPHSIVPTTILVKACDLL